MASAPRQPRWSHRVVRSAARWLAPRAELARVARMVQADAGHGYDRFGMHRDWVALADALLDPLYRHYFRVRSYGAEHLPLQGPAILIANHSGTLPIDGAMLCMDVLRHTEPPRIPRPVADRFVPRLPFAGALVQRVGAVAGSLGNVRALLEQGELCLIFPEGLAAIGKTREQRYQLQDWRVGHAELALQYGVPVVPVAVIGAEEQWPVLGQLRALHPYGLPYVPLVATPLPLPVTYHIHYGEPIDLRQHVTAPCDSSDAVHAAAELTRGALQSLIDRGVSMRTGVFS